jgi:uncharacterized protein (DUF1015 family)
MSLISPLRGVRYSTSAGTDISTKLAPPYDVLDAADKAALLKRDPRNFVRIDLPHVPAKEAGPPAVYAAARDQLRAWLQDGTLLRDAQPALYAYHQHYEHRGTRYLRKMFFARLRLEPLGSGSVFPHEKTFGGPKEDRLALMRATEANLSPIFVLYEDARNELAGALEAALGPAPVASGTLDDVQSRLWCVQDPTAIETAERLMSTRPTYIADGHHRYGTALLYREGLEKTRGALPEDHPANFVLSVFCAMEDPGLLILPTHRVLPRVPVMIDRLRGDEALDVQQLSRTTADEVIESLSQLGPQAVGVFIGPSDTVLAIRPRKSNILDKLEPDHSEAWRRLGVAFLHGYLLGRVSAPAALQGEVPEVTYIKSGVGAVELARETGGTAFLLQPTTMAELRAVCQAGDLMPQKSTYFYPKLASGLVVSMLTD